MPCDSCDRLKRQVRELKEEIAEWDRTENNESLADKLRLRFRLRPQAAYTLAAMIERPGRVFSKQAIIQHIGYDGSPMETKRDGEDQSVRTNISWVRSGLKYAGLDVEVRNIHAQGYLISKEDAEKVRALL